MFAVLRLIEGLFVGHLFLFAAFLVGASVFPWCEDAHEDVRPPQMMLQVLSTCVAGMGVYTFILFCLGSLHLLSTVAMTTALVAIIAVPSFLRKQSVLNGRYWASRCSVLSKSWDGPLVAVYYAMLFIAVPAVLPNEGGDPVNYHLAYAWDWATSGSLVVDPFLRFPLYANNYSLFFAMLIALGAAPFVNFIVWAPGLLIGLGICAAVRSALSDSVKAAWSALISLALTFAVVFSPVFLRWSVTAYFDVGQSSAALFAVISLRLAILERKPVWIAVAAVNAAFLIGMKESYLILLSVFFIALLYVARIMRFSRSALLAAITLLVVVASPWYARNLIYAGDPVVPALNIAIHGSDGLMSKDEWGFIQADLRTPRSVQSLISLPWRAFVHANSPAFRDFGTSALMLALFVPFLVLFWRFSSGKRTAPSTGLPIMILTVIAAYWFASSTYLRYSLVFYPLLAVCCALVVAPILNQRPRLAPVVAILALLAMIPTPGSGEFYRDLVKKNYENLPIRYTDDDSYLRLFNSGYIAEEYTNQIYVLNRLQGRIYVDGGATSSHFRTHGIVSMGDWVGIAGWFRLYSAVAAGKVPEYLESLDADVVLIDPTFIFGGLAIPLERELRQGGFCQISIPHDRFLLFVKAPCSKIALPD